MILELIEINEDIATECLSYVSKRFKLNLEVFITLDSHAQLGYIISYLQTKNIGILADLNNINLFWINPFLKVNEIILKYNDKGKLTDEIEFITLDKPSDDILDSYIVGIKFAFSDTLQPF